MFLVEGKPVFGTAISLCISQWLSDPLSPCRLRVHHKSRQLERFRVGASPVVHLPDRRTSPWLVSFHVVGNPVEHGQ
jgi:hypothetical protein